MGIYYILRIIYLLHLMCYSLLYIQESDTSRIQQTNADEGAMFETGPFEKLSTAGAIRLLSNYCQWCPIFF